MVTATGFGFCQRSLKHSVDPAGRWLGGFSGSTDVSVGSEPNSIAIGDFNGDGKQDLAVANYNSSTVSIRLGDGLGGFSGSTELSVGSNPYCVAVGDFNGNGKQDLAVANYFSNTVSILLGQCISCAPIPAGMVSWWPLDGDATDIYGSNSGTLQNSPPFVPGKVGHAISVNGTNGISVPTSSSLNFGAGADFSIDAWIRTSNTARNTLTIVDKRVVSGSSATGYALYLYQGQVGVELANGTLLDVTGLSSDLRNGQWHHVAVSIVRNSATGGRVYLDGALSATFNPTSKSGSLANNQPLLIGQNEYSAIANFVGEIDEVDVFNRAVSATDVASIYNAGSTGKCHTTTTPTPTPAPTCAPIPVGMVSWWPLEGNATDVYGPNNGTPQGAPGFVPGKVGQAMSVNGANGISVPDNSSLNFGAGADFSVDAWIRTSNTARNTLTIVDKRVVSGSNATGYAFYLYQGQVGVELANGTLLDFTGLSADLRNGQWHHIAVSIVRNSATGGRVYVDGALSATFNPTSKSGSLANNQPLLIGQNAYSATADFIGEIDEVDVSSRAMSATEVANIYNAGSLGKCH